MVGKPPASRRDLLLYTKRVLRSLGLKPSRSLGQHFLVDPRGVDLFLTGLHRSRSRRFLEIGSGLGVLTIPASELAELIVAVEIHPKLADFLGSMALDNVLVLRGDGVQIAASTVMKTVYSNTPFNLSSQLIVTLAKNNMVEEAILGVQLEVAERISAKPGEENYGRLTVITHRVFKVEKIGLMPPNYFYPKPEVYGAVVKLDRWREWSRIDDIIEDIARCIFTGRNRKVMKMVKECFNIELKSSPIVEKRVRELTPAEIEELSIKIVQETISI